MRKFLCCLIGILMLLSLGGCRFFSANTEPSESQKPKPSTSATGSQESTGATAEQTGPSGQVSIGQMPMYSLSLPVSEETITADDGTVLFRHTFQEVVLTTDNAAVTDAITVNLLQRIDANVASLNGLIDAAKNSYIPGADEDWSAFYFEVNYAATRIDGSVLSLHGIESSYAGSGVPSNVSVSVNYDMVTGKVLTLADVLSGVDGASEALCQILLDTLKEKAEENALFEDYADVISRRFQADLQQDSSWYFTEEGLCFFFHPYDIAPYSSGTIHATIPYGNLSGILADRFYPAEQPVTNGNILAAWFDDADLSSFEHFSELILDPKSESILLYTEGVAFDVTLEQGYWDSKTNSFTSESTVYAANCLSPGNAFVLQSPLSSTTPTLLLRYHANGKDYSYYILEDIQDETILLLAFN